TTQAAEHIAQDIFEAATAAAPAAAPARALHAFRSPGEGLERAILAAERATGAGAGTAPRTRAKTLETLKARLAFGVDLAAIEVLALVVVANDLVGRVQLGKPRRRLGIGLVGVGVELLGKL